MKKKNFIFCLAVFTIILLVTAMLYFYINRHQGREKPSPLTACRPKGTEKNETLRKGRSPGKRLPDSGKITAHEDAFDETRWSAHGSV